MQFKLLLVALTLALTACGKPFPVSQDVYDEYRGIVCKIAAGGLTAQDLARQMQLNAIFQQKLTEGGAPSADWVATHAKKLGEVMDVNNCGKVTAGTGGASGGAFAKFDGIWMLSLDKTRAANAEGDDMYKAMVQGTLIGLELKAANSAGMKIEGGRVQDGDGRCALEGAPDAKGLVSCVQMSDRSIYGKFMVDGNGDLLGDSVGDAMIKMVFEKKK